jgi:hypothetical protein
MLCKFDFKEKTQGWYSVSFFCDEQKRLLNRALYWDGFKWSENLPIIEIYGPFKIQEFAEKWANKNATEKS